MDLRHYQRESVDAITQALAKPDNSPCVVIPTGGGKTIIIAEIIRDYLTRWPNIRILVVTHRKELIQQNHDKTQAHFPGMPLGINAASLKRRDTLEQVIFCSIQSVYKRPHAFGDVALVIVDEAHHLPRNSDTMYLKFIEQLRYNHSNKDAGLPRVVGLTATPYRTDSGPIAGPGLLLSEIVYEAYVPELIGQGFLCPLDSRGSKHHANLDSVKVRAGEFVAGQLEAAMDDDELVNATVDDFVERLKDRKAWIIFCSGKKHAQHVSDVLESEHSICAPVIDADTPQAARDYVLRRFQSGGLRALVNINVLSEGFDAPHIDAVVMLRPTMSQGLYYQQVGRGLRMDPAKQDCLVLDYAGNIVRHGPIDTILPEDGASGDGTGEAPVKECPECFAFMPTAALVCTECGYEFPPRDEVKHESKAADVSILSNLADELPHRFPVDRVDYSRYLARSGYEMLRVTYSCGLRTFTEYIGYSHPENSYARRIANQWFEERDTDPPSEQDEIGATIVTLPDPVAIYVWNPNPKKSAKGAARYSEIKSYEWKFKKDCYTCSSFKGRPHCSLYKTEVPLHYWDKGCDEWIVNPLQTTRKERDRRERMKEAAAKAYIPLAPRQSQGR